MALVLKNLSANVGDVRDMSPIPGSGRSPGGGHGNPLQYSCLENPIDRRVWWAIVHSVAQNQTQPKQLSMHTRWFVILESSSLVLSTKEGKVTFLTLSVSPQTPWHNT